MSMFIKCIQMAGKVNIFDQIFRVKLSLYFKEMLIIVFQIFCGGIQSQMDKNCVTVHILMELIISYILSMAFTALNRGIYPCKTNDIACFSYWSV